MENYCLECGWKSTGHLPWCSRHNWKQSPQCMHSVTDNCGRCVPLDEIKVMPAGDMINHPPHYSRNPNGVEAIDVCEHLGFSLGNVIKYVLRSDKKGSQIEDLKKARWYLDREIVRLEKTNGHA